MADLEEDVWSSRWWPGLVVVRWSWSI